MLQCELWWIRGEEIAAVGNSFSCFGQIQLTIFDKIQHKEKSYPDFLLPQSGGQSAGFGVQQQQQCELWWIRGVEIAGAALALAGSGEASTSPNGRLCTLSSFLLLP